MTSGRPSKSWEWLAELLEDEGYEFHLAPTGCAPIAAARVKTDAVDARTLAHLLRADLLPEAYVVPRSCATCATSCASAWS
jgi:transposase